MARSTKNSGRASGKVPNQKFGKLKPSTSKSNAAGYEKRRSSKAKLLESLDTTDIYEYMPEKTRRERVRQELDKDEAAEFGLRLGEANEEEREAMRARLIGEYEDDEKIDSEDDEELDSDAAFEESDEERFAGFFSSKKKNVTKKKPTVRFADVDLNEDEEDELSEKEEEEEGDDDEFIDLLDVLDGKGEVDMGSDDEATKKFKDSKLPPKVLKPTSDDEDEDVGMEDEDDSEEEDDDEKLEGEDVEMAFAPSDDEDMSPAALDKLQDFVASLNSSSKKRKTREEGDATEETKQERARKRRQIKERNEAGTEDEFRAQSSGKLNLEDLLNPLASQSAALQSLKKATKVLAPTSSKIKTLDAPLPQRTQERLDREAAYEQTKEEVDKWTGTMKRIREAEHLSFPLQATPVGRTSNLELVAKFKPTTSLESAVDSLLRSANLRDEDIHKTEETMLEMNKLSVEEVAERRGELRKMRELMFRAEIKAKRIKKIKSKTYRKIKRKEKERLGEKLGDGEDSDTEEGRLKREIERAKERATLRHKHTGKWAKQMKHRGDMDEGGRKEIEEMLARGEKLRRRIKGVGSDESEGDDGSDDDNIDGDVEGGIEHIKQTAFDELRQLHAGDVSMDIEEQGKKGKSVFEMKFMKDAMARQQHATDKVADDFLREMGETLGESGDDSDAGEQETTDLDPQSGVIAQRQGGRIVYRPGTDGPQVSTKPLASLASDTSSVTLKSTDFLSPPPPFNHNHPVEEDQSNPWLARSEKSGSKVSRKNNEVIVDKDSKAVDKSKNKLKKKAAQKAEVREQAQDDAVVEISMETVLSTSTTAAASSSKPKGKITQQPHATTAAQDDDDDDDDVNSEIDIQEKMLSLKGKDKAKGLKAFEQKDLVARAFAGDNVVQQFEEAKEHEVEADAPKEIDTTIPGWGSWGGSGVRKAANRPKFTKKVAGVDPTKRADFGKKHVIISEKRDKKAAKYLVNDLPFPYTSKAQFERAMDTPLGTEWNTRVAFQRATLPRIVKKPGAIIEPLEKLEY
ncbi:Utp14 protein-domain-containing protein [Cyathus striatus]|nr:Utp14 protein-domain-containing protein [Cyathus striatus]